MERCSAETVFLRHYHTSFEYDAAKTVSMGLLAHIDFWPVPGLSLKAVWEIPMPKITLFFTRILIVVTAVLIGVLNF